MSGMMRGRCYVERAYCLCSHKHVSDDLSDDLSGVLAGNYQRLDTFTNDLSNATYCISQ